MIFIWPLDPRHPHSGLVLNVIDEYIWKKKIENSHEIYLHMNKKQNDYQDVNKTSFFICGSEFLSLLILCDLETSISGFYCSSSDL